MTDADAKSCLDNPQTYAAIEKRTSDANAKFNVSGTPTFIVNGTVVPEATSWDALKPALRAAGAL